MANEFSHRSLREARMGRRRLLAATVLVLVLFAIDIGTRGIVRSAARSAAALLWRGSSDVRAALFDTGYFRTRASLADENTALRAQVAQFQEKAAGYDALQSENAQLRAALHFAAATQGVTAPVVSSFHSSPYGTFMIGAGVHDPVALGDIVLSDGGFVIGVITDVQATTAEVRALFAAKENVDAIIGKTAVTLQGDGGGNAHAAIPLGVIVNEGDPVVSSRFEGRPIGTVGKVDSTPTSADQTVYVQLPLNLDSLRYVYVVHH